MAWHQVKCKDCNNGYAACEHSMKSAHVVSQAQAKNPREVGETCQPPMCTKCSGTGQVMKWRGR